MADNTSPLFAITPKLAKCNVSVANTALDGTGTVATLYTTVKKTKIERIWFVAEGTTMAGMIRLFITDSDGNNPDLFLEIPIEAKTVSASVEAATASVYFTDFTIPSGHVITASTHREQSSNIFMLLGELDT